MEKAELEKLVDSGVLQAQPDLQLWEQELQDLVDKGFLQHLSQQQIYTFSNNLTWEVVYETLLFAERRRIHNLVAEHIEKNNQNRLNSVASILLHHYDKADNYRKVIYYGARAGDRAGSLFANEDAVSFYNSAISALDNIDGNTMLDKCLLLEHIGDIYDVAGQYQQAIENYQSALQIWLQEEKADNVKNVPWDIKFPIYEAILCRKLAVMNERSSEYDKAIMWLNSAEQSLPARPGSVKAQILATRSGIFYRKGEFQEAVKTGKEAVKIAKRLHAEKDLAYANNALANSLIAMGQYAQAVDVINIAIDIYKKGEDFPGLALSYYNLGTCQSNMGELDAAEDSYRKVLSMDEKMRNMSAMAMDYVVLGTTVTMKGAYDEAIDYFEKVVDFFEQGKSRPDVAGVALSKLSTLYMNKNDPSRAEESIKYGLELLEKVGAKAHIFRGQLQLAELKCQQGALSEAELICRNVLESMNENENINIAASARNTLGDILTKMEKYDQAFIQYDKCASLAASSKKELFVAQALHNKAISLLQAGKANIETLNTLNDVMDIYRRSKASSLLKDAQDLYEKIRAEIEGND